MKSINNHDKYHQNSVNFRKNGRRNIRNKALDDLFVKEQLEVKQDMMLYKCWLSEVLHQPMSIKTMR